MKGIHVVFLTFNSSLFLLFKFSIENFFGMPATSSGKDQCNKGFSKQHPVSSGSLLHSYTQMQKRAQHF